MAALSIELRDMKWAIIASQHKSLRQAAAALNVRQSTLSRRLRESEERLGVQLFERSNGGTHPTTAGREFLAAAQKILGETETALHKLKTRACGENGRLTIGIYASLSVGNMLATLIEHHREFPDVEVHVVDGSHDQLLCSLANCAVDIAIMTNSRAGWNDRVLPLWSERVILASHRHHALAEKDVVRWSDLAGETILIPQNGPGPELARLLNSRLGDYGRQHILRQESALDRLLSLVAAEYGTLLMLEGGTGIRLENVVYREIHDDDGATRLGFTAHWRQSNENPTLPPFLAVLRKRFPEICESSVK